MMFRFLFLFFVAGSGLVLAAGAQQTANYDSEILRKWIANRLIAKTLIIEFEQTRKLKILRTSRPYKGKLWIDGAEAFRWQIGEPPKMMMVKNPAAVYLIKPQKMTAKRQAIDENSPAMQQQREMLNLYTKPHALVADFVKYFEILGARQEGILYHVETRPRDARIRKQVEKIVFSIHTGEDFLKKLDITLVDGSQINTTITHAIANRKLDKRLFSPDLAGYTIEQGIDR